MSKFHINKKGVPAPCKATKGNCPLGGESGNENHYNTQEEAQAGADIVNEAKYGKLPGTENIIVSEYSEPEITEETEDFSESLPIQPKAPMTEEEIRKDPRSMRTKVRLLGPDMMYSPSEIQPLQQEQFYEVEDLNGKRRRIQATDYLLLKDSNMLAENGQSAYEIPSGQEQPAGSIEFKSKLVDTEYREFNTGYGVELDQYYKVMDSNGDARWVEEYEFNKMNRSGTIATKDERFLFPEAPNEEVKVESKPGFMGRIRGLFGG